MECKIGICLFWGFFLALGHVIQYGSFILSLVTPARCLHWFSVIIYYHLVPLFFTLYVKLNITFSYSVRGTAYWIWFITFVYISCSGILFCYLKYAVLLISLVCTFFAYCSTYIQSFGIHSCHQVLSMSDKGKYQQSKNLLQKYIESLTRLWWKHSGPKK